MLTGTCMHMHTASLAYDHALKTMLSYICTFLYGAVVCPLGIHTCITVLQFFRISKTLALSTSIDQGLNGAWHS